MNSNYLLAERLELFGGGTKAGDPVHIGTVFLDQEPVCGRGWDDVDAGVACRSVRRISSSGAPVSASSFQADGLLLRLGDQRVFRTCSEGHRLRSERCCVSTFRI